MEQKDYPLLGQIVGQMTTEMFRVLKKRTGEQPNTKLTVEQFALLYAINNQKDDAIQQDMANFMGKDKSTILRLTDILEEKELLRRVVDTKDRRKNYLMVTKKGEVVISEYLKVEFQLIEELLKGLSKSEIEVFCKVVNHIKNSAQEL
ncbi:MAG: MarR family transcriptional regulator [Bacteroidales bacterium]|nr:MarR family transcriptional regulator [Bacteroidales bacterium]